MRVTVESSSNSLKELWVDQGKDILELEPTGFNSKRANLFIQNKGSVTIFVEFAQDATTTDSVEIAAGAFLSFDFVNIRDVNLISDWSDNEDIKFLLTYI